MANRRHRLAGAEELPHEVEGLFITTQRVRIHYTTGQQQRAVIVSRRLFKRHIYREFLTPILEIPGLHGPALRRDYVCLGPSFFERLLWLSQFHLFETLGDEDGNFLVF